MEKFVEIPMTIFSSFTRIDATWKKGGGWRITKIER